jgi:uncharacterized protein YdcH (DUF465 family)
MLILFVLYLAFCSVDEGFVPTPSVLSIRGISKICTPDTPGYSDKSICYDISYIDQNMKLITNSKAQIQDGYFINANGLLEIVPYGYMVSSDKRSYSAKTNTANYEQPYFTNVNTIIDASINRLQDIIKTANARDIKGYENQIVYLENQKLSVKDDNKISNKRYNSDNFNITYHTDPTKETPTDANNLVVGRMWINDEYGNLKSVPYDDVKNTTHYYPSGSYVFNPPAFVPNYEESVFLSKVSNVPTFTILDNKDQYKGSRLDNELRCNASDKHRCMRSGNCVLFGGEKCVSGDQMGPTIKSNYSDITVINRDYYYYKGTCYGNCPYLVADENI